MWRRACRQTRGGARVQVNSINNDTAADRTNEPFRDAAERRFARPRVTDNPDKFARDDVEGNGVQRNHVSVGTTALV